MKEAGETSQSDNRRRSGGGGVSAVCGAGLGGGGGAKRGTLKWRPTGWLSALDCDGNVTGLKTQVEGQLFGL